MEGVYVSTTIDDASGIMYVKVVNVGDGYADGVINLSNCMLDAGRENEMQLIRLSSGNGSDENTMATPHKIHPVSADLKIGVNNDVIFDVPAYSVNILRLQLK